MHLYSRLLLGTILVAGSICFAAPAAMATACCQVRKTSDGFLALRSGPGPAFQLIRKIPSGDVVCFGSRDPSEPDTGVWIYGWYSDETGKQHYGWVNSAFLEKECG